MPLGGTSTIASLFKLVMSRFVIVNEMLLIVPERPLTVIEEPSEVPVVPLTVIPLDEVQVVTLLEVEHWPCARAGISRADRESASEAA